jgi:methylaspartate mutase epsilon subunit
MTPPLDTARPSFGDFVAAAERNGNLVVQPRMGFGDLRRMRAGLVATKAADAVSVGTLTLDSYTRTGNHEAARRALADGVKLNGYPIVARPDHETVELLDGVRDTAFPVQVRHGSSRPQDIFRTLTRLGLEATEGGPVSYCLPYSRTPLREAVDSWVESTELFAESGADGRRPHVESFGGCMLGQLCPPSLLVAISLLEGVFFRQHGIRSLSLSYAQQIHPAQDEEAVLALRRLASEYLPDTQWHIVFYAYMGVYPRTSRGAVLLMEQAARTAVRAGAARVIVKTEAEAHRIPTIEENIRALEASARAAETAGPRVAEAGDSGVLAEARALVEAVLDIDPDVGRALPRAFERGRLDLPFCLHPDNRGQARSYIGDDGYLRWLSTGNMPIPVPVDSVVPTRLTADALLMMLHHVEQRYDRVT